MLGNIIFNRFRSFDFTLGGSTVFLSVHCSGRHPLKRSFRLFSLVPIYYYTLLYITPFCLLIILFSPNTQHYPNYLSITFDYSPLLIFLATITLHYPIQYPVSYYPIPSPPINPFDLFIIPL